MIRRHSCPICAKQLPPNAASEVKSFPFCSTRCQQIDLLRWTEGRYAIVENLDPEVARFLDEHEDEVDF